MSCAARLTSSDRRIVNTRRWQIVPTSMAVPPDFDDSRKPVWPNPYLYGASRAQLGESGMVVGDRRTQSLSESTYPRPAFVPPEMTAWARSCQVCDKYLGTQDCKSRMLGRTAAALPVTQYHHRASMNTE